MAVTIAKLSAVLGLDSTKFSSGLGKVRADIGAFSAISLGAFSRIGGMITNFTARAVTTLPNMVVASLKAGDALNELASELGFTADALANLQRVAGLSGIDMGQLQTSIGKMNQVLGDAVGGSESAQKAFDALGLSVETLSKQKPEDTYFAILDALKQIPTVAGRAAASVDVFGKGGRGQLKLIGLGSSGIKAEAENTRRLGIASRPRDLAQLERANDTLDDLKNNLKGFGDQLALRLAPKIEAVGNDFLGFSKNTNLAANTAEFFARQLQTAALFIAGLTDKFGFTENAQDELFDSLERLNRRPPGSEPEARAPLTGRQAEQQKLIDRQAFTWGRKVERLAETPAQKLVTARANAIFDKTYEGIQSIPATQEMRNKSPLDYTKTRAQVLEERYLQEMVEELKKISVNTKGGGARN